MIRLVRVEVLRLLSRRLVKVVAALVLLLVVLIVGIDAYNSEKSTAAEDAAFRQRRAAAYDRDITELQRLPEGERPPLEELPSREQVVNGGDCIGPATCEVDRKLPYVVSRKLHDGGIGVAVICAIVAFLVGASAAGAEWAAGTMQSLLFWESRRVRVVLAKVLGLFLVIAALVVVAEAVFTVASIPAGQLRGTTAGLTSGVWTSYLLLVLRGIGVATFAGVLGFSIAFGTRVTGAALGIGFIYFAILDGLLTYWKPWLGRYMINSLLGGFFNLGTDVQVRDTGEVLHLSATRAGVTLAIYAAVMVAVATVWFRQRDVT